ncbi:probable tRNA N6-adenosine threonylcarbamoyltransferase, mitochondrial isoform X2 [Vigna umbellata]|uniref:probable tRNA N6-adenosine threonylcarbamoyltransferase, mitochondrial isoform X2 n=1 Tax=Vigna umbellata TaxID=87088 RepID=UPI001F5E7BE0|nr:probable tRNA N6-adenosine threonylcarbamoyltransferase, mitochondrial isoform X2 [Vigna umbellata]
MPLSLVTMASPLTLSRIKLLLNPPSLFSALTNLRRNQLPLKSPFTTSSSAISSSSKRHADVVVLGIETSCDDTAAAVVRSDGEILSQVVSSQADLLAKYGGVAPKMAEEAHSQAIDRWGFRKPVELLADLVYQLLAYITWRLMLWWPGGHNLLILARDLGQYIQLGTTIDDAIGEAYDKTAKWLGLDLRRSGGPAIEKLAMEGNAESVKFSIPMKQHKDCNFSYAGLKTQVRLAIESKKIDAKIPISSASEEDRMSRADIAASFQRTAVLHLEERCERAIQWALKMEPSIRHLVVSGGVASNQYVRARLDMVAKKNGLQLLCPPPRLCTDNGNNFS